MEINKNKNTLHHTNPQIKIDVLGTPPSRNQICKWVFLGYPHVCSLESLWGVFLVVLFGVFCFVDVGMVVVADDV